MFSRRVGLFCVLAEVKDAYVAEFYARSVTAETDVAVFVEEADVIFMIRGVRIFFRPVGRYVVSLTCLADVTVGNNLPVDCDGNMVADGTDFLGVPLLDGTKVEVLGDKDAVDGTMFLIVEKAFVNRVIVIKYLYFHTVVGRIDIFFCADADTVVHARHVEEEFEAEDEVTVFFIGVKISATSVIGCDVDIAVYRDVAGGVAVPLIQGTSVEKDFEALLFLFGVEGEDGC